MAILTNGKKNIEILEKKTYKKIDHLKKVFNKEHVEVIPVDYKYSFGNQSHKVGSNRNSVQEYLFLGY